MVDKEAQKLYEQISLTIDKSKLTLSKKVGILEMVKFNSLYMTHSNTRYLNDEVEAWKK